MLLYQIIAFTIHGKILKNHTKTYLKYQLWHEIKSLNYQMDHILDQMFKIILNILKKHGQKSDNPSIRKFVNKIENRITFKIKTEYYLNF